MKNNMTPDQGQIKAHLKAMFYDVREHGDGKIEIAYTPTESGAVNRAEYFDIENWEEAAEFAYNKNLQEGVNVYVGAAIRKPGTAPFGRSNINDYYASLFIWCDLDSEGVAAEAKNKYSKLPPSFVVVTGRAPYTRAQAWWRLAIEEADKETLKQHLDFACRVLNGDPAVVDPARVMRIAGSVAWPKKQGRVAELTEFIQPESATKIVFGEKFKDYFSHLAVTPTAISEKSAHVKPRDLTGKLKISELLERTRTQGQWHYNMRDAIASMVSKGWGDEQIRTACAPYCDNGAYDPDLQPLIYSARNKWNMPEPEKQIDPETGEIIEPQAAKLYYVPGRDIKFDIEDTSLIKDILGQQELSVIYGESNCGKTFFMTDLALHVARGINYRGHRTAQGGVMYAALEGARGFSQRYRAYCIKHNIDGDIPFAMMPCALDFYSENANIGQFIDLIKKSQDDIGDPKLIVIDTLARAMAGGDENSGQDMGRLVYYADLIRNQTSAALSFVHHSGKNKALGARGHSSLRAAVDTEIEISREEGGDISTVRFVKQREMEMIDDMNFALERVCIGQNNFAEEITSCVVVAAQRPENEKRGNLTPKQAFVYEAIVACLDTHGKERTPIQGMQPVRSITYNDLALTLDQMGFGQMFKEDGENTALMATKETRIALRDKNYIGFTGSLIWLLSQ